MRAHSAAVYSRNGPPHHVLFACPESGCTGHGLSEELHHVLLATAGILLLAKFGAHVCESLRLPGVLGELGSGILVGNLPLLGHDPTAIVPCEVVSRFSGLPGHWILTRLDPGSEPILVCGAGVAEGNSIRACSYLPTWPLTLHQTGESLHQSPRVQFRGSRHIRSVAALRMRPKSPSGARSLRRQCSSARSSKRDAAMSLQATQFRTC